MNKPDAPNKPRRGNSKDTRRWCTGVVGRAHKWKRRDYFELKYGPSKTTYRFNWKIDVCESCGRHGKLYE